MLRFLIVFISVLLALFMAELTAPVQRVLVVPWTTFLASLSGGLINLVDPSVLTQGNVLQDRQSGLGIAVQAGCNGVEACIMLIAAVLAYPSRWQEKMPGLLVGVVAIQALNVVRIVSLFYLVQWSARAFEFAHLYLWQALIMIDVLLVWLMWLRWVTHRQYSAASPMPAAA